MEVLLGLARADVIDDLFIIRTGSMAQLCEFRKALATADNNISLDWSGYKSQEQAVDPIVVCCGSV